MGLIDYNTSTQFYVVFYSDEKGNAAEHRFSRDQRSAAVEMFEQMHEMFAPEYGRAGFPAADTSMEMIGWFTESIAQYGYLSYGSSDEYGNYTLGFAAMVPED